MSVPDPVQDAAAAIVALINSSPRSPRQEEIEAILARITHGASHRTEGTTRTSVLRARIAKAAAEADKALDALSAAMGADYDAARVELVLREERVADLEAEIPNPPQCFEDLVARAEIALYGGDVVNGKLMEAESDDLFIGPAGRLVEAVLQFSGAQASPLAMSPAHAAHYREWRRLIEAHGRELGALNPTADSEIAALEARMAAHMEAIDALSGKIFAEPARTWGDVMLYAQLCAWYHWAGIDPEGPEAPVQMRGGPFSVGGYPAETVARLLEAIFTVAGVGQFAGAQP